MEKLFPDKIHNKHDPTADSKKLWSTLHPIRNFRIFRIIKSHARQPSGNTYVANIPMKPTTACERHVRIKRLNIFHSNLHVINKFSKPMTMLVKTIMGSQTTTLLRNRFPKHVCIYSLTPCFIMRRLKIFRRIKTLRNTTLFHVPIFNFLQRLYLPFTRIYARGKHRIRILQRS